MSENKRDIAAAKTKKKILQAARTLFLKKGFNGVSISEIAKKAGINQSLIYHYYQSKEDLWKHVKNFLVESYASLDHLLFDATKGLRSLLEHTVYTRFDFYEKNPDIIRLMAWQRLEPTRDKLSGGTILSPDRWKPLLLQLQQQGEIRSEINIDLMIFFMTTVITAALAEDSQGYLKDPGNKTAYLNMLIESLIGAFGMV